MFLQYSLRHQPFDKNDKLDQVKGLNYSMRTLKDPTEILLQL